jgi:small conductance mechanosensitive channel
MFAQSSDVCADDSGRLCELLYDLTGDETVTEWLDLILARPLAIAIVVALAWILRRVAHRAVAKLEAEMLERNDQDRSRRLAEEVHDGRFDQSPERMREKSNRIELQTERARQRTRTLGTVLRSTTTAAIVTLATLIILAEIGVNLGPLIAGAGIAGVALGFGTQSLVKDFVSGIFMLLEDQYGVGDVVDLGDATGVVEDVSLRVTKIRDVDGTLWYIPNGEIRRVANLSQEWARTVMDIEVAYDTDLVEASDIIKRVADEVWQDHLNHATILEEPEIWGVEKFGDNSISIRLVLVVEPGEQWATAREIRGRLKPAFDAAGIEIPFPQRSVWLHSEPEPTADRFDGERIPTSGSREGQLDSG